MHETQKIQTGRLQEWLDAMPPESLDRLRTINAHSATSSHIIIALAFGIYDSHIRRLNRMITHLLLSRMKAERQGNEQVVARINGLMEQMHLIVDRVTGIQRPPSENGQVCNRPGRKNTANQLASLSQKLVVHSK